MEFQLSDSSEILRYPNEFTKNVKFLYLTPREMEILPLHSDHGGVGEDDSRRQNFPYIRMPHYRQHSNDRKCQVLSAEPSH